jgi:hypothetical protein
VRMLLKVRGAAQKPLRGSIPPSGAASSAIGDADGGGSGFRSRFGSI